MRRATVLAFVVAGACAPVGISGSVESSSDGPADGDGDDSNDGTDSPTATTSSGSTSAAEQGDAGGDGSDDDDDGAASTESTGEPEEDPRWLQIIRAEPYPRLVIEVDYVAGREPRPAVADEIEATFAAILDKPLGIDVVVDQPIVSLGAEHAWTVQERIDLADATNDLPVGGDTIKIHMLFLDGHAEEDDSMDGVILGAAWAHENIVMFRDTLDAGCEGLVVGPVLEQMCADAEFLIWQHEIGHVIGLVDGGLPMQSDHLDPDPTAGRHDVSHDCVMYREYEGTDAIDAAFDRIVMGGPAIEFDAPCLADIAAARDGA
jgi:prepilin-type processing-associated H-X9-DG protein